VACRLRYINLGTASRLRFGFSINHGKNAPRTNGKSNTPNNEEQGPNSTRPPNFIQDIHPVLQIYSPKIYFQHVS
jgi:hypothetical protein